MNTEFPEDSILYPTCILQHKYPSCNHVIHFDHMALLLVLKQT